GEPDYAVPHFGAAADEIVNASGAHVMTLPPLPLEAPPMAHPKRDCGIGDADGDGLPDLVIADLQGNNGFATTYVVSLAPVSTTPHGAGTAGCFGAHHLVASDAPKVGSATFGFRADAMSRSSFTLLAVSSSAAKPDSLAAFGVEGLVDLGAPELYTFGMP